MQALSSKVLFDHVDNLFPQLDTNRKHLGVGLALLLTQQAWAVPETNLGTFGQTQLQQDTGDAVQQTCGGFVAAGADANAVPLFATCRAMVHTGNELNADNEGPTAFSLGLSEDQLAASLQQIATEEFAATESMATEIADSRMDPVMTRLVELRGGSRGFSVAGLLPGNDNDAEVLAMNGWSDTAGASGGAAGADDLGSSLGGFINASYGTGERDDTDRTDSFEYDSYNIMLGIDYRFASDFVLGAAINYYNIDSDFDEKPTVSGGDIEADGWGGSVYATWYRENFYFDAVAGYASSDYDLNRSIFIPDNNPNSPGITETAQASPESTDFTFGIGAGYNFNRDALNWGPYFRATYINVDTDDYQERGAEASGLNLRVNGEEWESLTTVLGAQFSYALSRGFGVLMPHIRLGWIHQFENDAIDMTAVYVDDPRSNVLKATTDDPDEDYAELAVGFSAAFKGGMQAFFNYDTLLGFDELTTHLFTVGVRWEY
ncbi:MAG: autotransporter outer membrane beta-barrel domain-containing protein [Pseudomonadales bacterium]